MAVRILALAFVVAQVMSRGERFFDGNLVHPLPLYVQAHGRYLRNIVNAGVAGRKQQGESSSAESSSAESSKRKATGGRSGGIMESTMNPKVTDQSLQRIRKFVEKYC